MVVFFKYCLTFHHHQTIENRTNKFKKVWNEFNGTLNHPYHFTLFSSAEWKLKWDFLTTSYTSSFIFSRYWANFNQNLTTLSLIRRSTNGGSHPFQRTIIAKIHSITTFNRTTEQIFNQWQTWHKLSFGVRECTCKGSVYQTGDNFLYLIF